MRATTWSSASWATKPISLNKGYATRIVNSRHTRLPLTPHATSGVTRWRRHLAQVVTVEDAKEVAASLNLSYFETSAKTGILSHPPR